MSYLRFLKENRLFLLAGFLLSFSSSYGQTFFISLFAADIMAAHGLTDGGWGIVYAIATTTSAVAMIWVGLLSDRFRVRVLAVWVLFGLAVACLMMTQAPGVWWLVLTVFLLRFMGQGMLSHLSALAMSRWFVATRGKALSLASTGFGAGTALLPLVFAGLLALLDWRWLWVGAAAVLVCSVPLMSLLLRQERTPQSMAESAQSHGMQNRHWTRTEVLRTPIFWLLVPALLGPPAWGTALFFQQVHLTEVKGWSHVAYVALFPLMTVVAIGATFACGAIIDRFGSGRVLPYYMLPFMLAFLWIAQAQTLTGAAIGLVIFGLGQGMQATVAVAFWAEFFGTRHLGSIKAVAGAIMVFGSAIGPGVTGGLIDAGIDFPQQMIAIAVYFAVAAAAATIATRQARASLPALA